MTDEANAEVWVRGNCAFSSAAANAGDCVVFNAWAADTGVVNRFILQAAREVIRDHRSICFKRHHADRSTRPVRMSANDFIGAHLHRCGRRAMA